MKDQVFIEVAAADERQKPTDRAVEGGLMCSPRGIALRDIRLQADLALLSVQETTASATAASPTSAGGSVARFAPRTAS